MKKPKFTIFEKQCEVCGKPFRRSGPIDAPPRFCGQDCLNFARMGRSYEKYVIPDEYLPVIRDMYARGVGKGEVAKMAKRLHVPRTKITNIARSNGWIPRRVSKDFAYYWCDREDEIVAKTGHCAPITVQRRLKAEGFDRTISAIEIRRAKLRAVQNRKGMSGTELAECLGVDFKTVESAIKKGRIPNVKKRPGYTGPRAAYMVRSKAIKEYIINWLPEINIAKCDKYWLVDLLTS